MANGKPSRNAKRHLPEANFNRHLAEPMDLAKLDAFFLIILKLLESVISKPARVHVIPSRLL
jgi:hypothetical protein